MTEKNWDDFEWYNSKCECPFCFTDKLSTLMDNVFWNFFRLSLRS